MTWYAHHVFAEPLPAVIEALARVWPVALYHVPELDAPRAARREVYAIAINADGPGREETRAVMTSPRLPPAGLVVVRELAHPSSQAAEWFGDAAVSWLDSPPSTAPAPLAPAEIFAGVDLGVGDALTAPPVALLAGLRAISRATARIVTLICSMTWGGDFEYAFAWVFDGAWAQDQVYVHQATPAGPVVHAWSSTAPDRPRVVAGGHVLTLALVHHGVQLDDGFFPLFTRAFPWPRYRLG